MTQQAEPVMSDDEFSRDLTDLLPHLRAFGRSMVGSPEHADDLVQDTMVKAWGSRHTFKPGTSMRAWTFTILRNTYLTELRRAKFVGEYDELAAERQLQQPGDQGDSIDLQDLQRAMMELPADQREALVLVGATGLAYAEAAEIAGCAVGTMKSRVSRGRTQLAALLNEDAPTPMAQPVQVERERKGARFDLMGAIDKAIAKLSASPEISHA